MAMDHGDHGPQKQSCSTSGTVCCSCLHAEKTGRDGRGCSQVAKKLADGLNGRTIYGGELAIGGQGDGAGEIDCDEYCRRGHAFVVRPRLWQARLRVTGKSRLPLHVAVDRSLAEGTSKSTSTARKERPVSARAAPARPRPERSFLNDRQNDVTATAPAILVE
ncbi:hypothetical protein BKA66DRAFT_572165 [Pyrenochaeta sp. MPI-SDFR-AT-0127]|nr:hypothetical protein BKA66DRAFT_572165 [Pyrenochaeta sp. MPI-SDFR-AT-0127]